MDGELGDAMGAEEGEMAGRGVEWQPGGWMGVGDRGNGMGAGGKVGKLGGCCCCFVQNRPLEQGSLRALGTCGWT